MKFRAITATLFGLFLINSGVSQAEDAIRSPIGKFGLNPPLHLVDVLNYLKDDVRRHCEPIAKLIHDETGQETDEIRVAKTTYEVWCLKTPSLSLSQDLNSERPLILVFALHNWALSMVDANPNGRSNLSEVQNWFVDHYDDPWANLPAKTRGITSSPIRRVMNILVQFDALGPVLDSPRLSPDSKRSIISKRDEMIETINMDRLQTDYVRKRY
jgi:hypothetical protein